MRGSEHKRSWPVRETAGAVAMGCLGLEHAGIRARGTDSAAIGVTTIGQAHQFAKNAAERTPNDIPRFVRREVERARGAKLKSKPIEFERQGASIAPFLPLEAEQKGSLGSGLLPSAAKLAAARWPVPFKARVFRTSLDHRSSSGCVVTVPPIAQYGLDVIAPPGEVFPQLCLVLLSECPVLVFGFPVLLFG
jgi:hypothetical protein